MAYLDNPINSPGDEDGYLRTLVACPTIEKCPYSNRQEISRRRLAGGSECEWESEWVLLTDIDSQTFTRDFLNSDDNDNDDQHELPITWSTFDATLKLLLIRIPRSEPHEVAAHLFEEVFLDAVQDVGMKRSLIKTGSVTCISTGGGKQADLSYSPLRLPRDRSRDWPSVVLEVAFAESKMGQVKLMSDVRFWLNQSHGNVKIALTLRVEQDRPAIVIESWEENNGRIHRTQHVTVVKAADNVKISGPITFEFEKLFLRKAETGKESDMKINPEDLEYMAQMIWVTQSFS